MKEYNKLVRDNIPQAIKDSGFTCKTRILNDDEYIKALKLKLVEESTECSKTTSKTELIEELADVFEVLDYLLIAEKIDLFDVQEYRVKKNMKKGGFDDKVFLEFVE